MVSISCILITCARPYLTFLEGERGSSFIYVVRLCTDKIIFMCTFLFEVNYNLGSDGITVDFYSVFQ